MVLFQYLLFCLYPSDSCLGPVRIAFADPLDQEYKQYFVKIGQDENLETAVTRPSVLLIPASCTFRIFVDDVSSFASLNTYLTCVQPSFGIRINECIVEQSKDVNEPTRLVHLGLTKLDRPDGGDSQPTTK